MEKHKYSKEEVEAWRKEHRSVFYFNREDKNLFVPKRFTFGFSPNFAHPLAWVIILAVVGVIVVFRVFYKQIFG